jgi:hypothetical protein
VQQSIHKKGANTGDYISSVKNTSENLHKSFGNLNKSTIFAPAIEKRWRDSSAG